MEPQMHHPDNAPQEPIVPPAQPIAPAPMPMPAPAPAPVVPGPVFAAAPGPVYSDQPMAAPAVPTMQMATPMGGGVYNSNPFITTMKQLGVIVTTNPISVLTLSLYLLLLFFVAGILSGLISSVAPTGPTRAIAMLALGIFYIVMFIRFTAASVCIHIASKEGRTLTSRQAIAEVKNRNFNGFFFAFLLSGIFVGLGFIALVIPGLILMGRLCLAPYIAMNEKLGAMAAIKRSMKLTKGHFFEAFSSLISSGVVSSGLLSFVGGQSGVIGRYNELLELEKSGQPKPKSHWMNFFLPVIAFIGAGIYIAVIAISASNANNINKLNNSPYDYCGSSSISVDSICNSPTQSN